MKARKKPVIIDYFEILPHSIETLYALIDWVRTFEDIFEDHFDISDAEEIKVKTLEGTSYILTDHDMVLRGPFGEYYPCKKHIFLETYELL